MYIPVLLLKLFVVQLQIINGKIYESIVENAMSIKMFVHATNRVVYFPTNDRYLYAQIIFVENIIQLFGKNTNICDMHKLFVNTTNNIHCS